VFDRILRNKLNSCTQTTNAFQNLSFEAKPQYSVVKPVSNRLSCLRILKDVFPSYNTPSCGYACLHDCRGISSEDSSSWATLRRRLWCSPRKWPGWGSRNHRPTTRHLRLPMQLWGMDSDACGRQIQLHWVLRSTQTSRIQKSDSCCLSSI